MVCTLVISPSEIRYVTRSILDERALMVRIYRVASNLPRTFPCVRRSRCPAFGVVRFPITYRFPLFHLHPRLQQHWRWSPLRSPLKMTGYHTFLDRYHQRLASVGTPNFLRSHIVTPRRWTLRIGAIQPEPDGDLHQPDPQRDVYSDSRIIFTLIGFVDLGCLVLLPCVVTLLFVFAPMRLTSYVPNR